MSDKRKISKHQKRCDDSSSSSSSSSSSDSESEREYRRKRREKRRHNKSRSHSKSHSKSRGRSHSKSCERRGSKSRSHSPEKHCEDECRFDCWDNDDHDHNECYPKNDFERLYCKFKHQMIHDPRLMVKGCTAYASVYNDIDMNVPIKYPVTFNKTQEILNVDVDTSRDSLYVRESGVYMISCALWAVEPCQFGVYVNGTAVSESVVGTNTGASETFGRFLYKLKKDDAVTIRNHTSSIATGTVHFTAPIGGARSSVNAHLLLVKVAPYCDFDCDKFRCGRRWKHLFEDLECKLRHDCDLLVKGAEALAFVNSTVDQMVAVDAPIVFTGVVESRETELDSTKTAVTVHKDGIYIMQLLCATAQASQWTVFVNGSEVPSTRVGTNSGAGQLIFHQLLSLKCNDVVTVRNYTSAAGTIALSMSAGGTLVGNSVDFILYKIANNKCGPYDHKDDDDWYKRYDKDCLYEKFLCYLLSRRHLRIQGVAESFISVSTSDIQNVALEKPVTWEYENISRDMCLTQGMPKIHVKESGLYNIMFDVECDLPSQFTLFVNGAPNIVTISGTDSGAGQCSIRTIIPLCRHDCVTAVNHTSYMGTIPFSINPGGTEVGINGRLIAMNIAPLCHYKEKKEECCEKK